MKQAIAPKVTDLIVVVPGIMGSVLAFDNGKEIWAPSRGAVLRAIATFGKSIKDLTLNRDIGDGPANDGVVATRLMPDIQILPGIWTAQKGYRDLLQWVTKIGLDLDSQGEPRNLVSFPYDWRLSNRYNATVLKGTIERRLEQWRKEYPDAKIIFICHSMGGLIVQWYVRKLGGDSLTRTVFSIGTPYQGAAKALVNLVNGPRIGIWPKTINLGGFVRSMPSIYQLLPSYPSVRCDGLLYELSELELPNLEKTMVEDGLAFQAALSQANDDSRASSTPVYPILGWRQPTITTCELAGKELSPWESIDGTRGGENRGGDGTVPITSAIPPWMDFDSPFIRGHADDHSSLQCNDRVYETIEFVLFQKDMFRPAGMEELAVRVDEHCVEGEDVIVSAATLSDLDDTILRVQVRTETGKIVRNIKIDSAETCRIGGLTPGMYEIQIGGLGANAARISPVTALTLVVPRRGLL